MDVNLSPSSFQWIATNVELEALKLRLELKESCIGVDMEFMTCAWDDKNNRYSSVKYETPRLSLIQISTLNGGLFDRRAACGGFAALLVAHGKRADPEDCA